MADLGPEWLILTAGQRPAPALLLSLVVRVGTLPHLMMARVLR